mmetsp:Transcript_18517/g.26069  ORF Transcript_18517/g.26069 Transcript_18517/m.26069 type:complete len:137 (+) Transcript_18517:896-1306(+)
MSFPCLSFLPTTSLFVFQVLDTESNGPGNNLNDVFITSWTGIVVSLKVLTSSVQRLLISKYYHADVEEKDMLNHIDVISNNTAENISKEENIADKLSSSDVSIPTTIDEHETTDSTIIKEYLTFSTIEKEDHTDDL